MGSAARWARLTVVSTQLGEIAQPTFSDRVHGFLHPRHRPEATTDSDKPPRTVNGEDFDDVVMILEAVVDALRVRVANSPARDETDGRADQIARLVDKLLAAGGDIDREDQAAGEEWNRDLRYILAVGVDSDYEER